MSDACKTIHMTVEIQENGIIRRPDGYLLGRINDNDKRNTFTELERLFSEPQPQTLEDYARMLGKLPNTPVSKIVTLSNTVEPFKSDMTAMTFPKTTETNAQDQNHALEHTLSGMLDQFQDFQKRILIELRTSQNFGNPNLKVTQDTLVSDFGFDSLDHAEFCMWLEDEFGIEIDDAEIEKFRTKPFTDLVAFIQNRGGV